MGVGKCEKFTWGKGFGHDNGFGRSSADQRERSGELFNLYKLMSVRRALPCETVSWVVGGGKVSIGVWRVEYLTAQGDGCSTLY